MKSLLVISLFILVFSQTQKATAQPALSEHIWKKLSPLVSNCDDVKKLLGESQYNCMDGSSHYKFPDYWISVYFTTQTCKQDPHESNYNVPKGTVVHISVSLRRLILLKDYVKDLSKYKVKPVPDLEGSVSYISEAEGITISVFNNENYGELITSILLYPSLDKIREKKCHQRKNRNTQPVIKRHTQKKPRVKKRVSI